jgi:type I restriction enzyme, S subunit
MVIAMEAPKGYKKTEVGLIPEDWEINDFKKSITKVIDNRGKTPPLASHGYPMLEVNAIYNVNKYPDFKKVSKYVDEQTYKYWFRDGHPQKGDILIATVGTVGASAIMDEEIGCIAQNIVGLKISTNFSSDFIYYYTQTDQYKSQVRAVLMGAVQPSLKVPHLLNFLITYPTNKTEQTAIAAILSDADRLISVLEKLIAKKRNVKQGAMQELLTGKKRLPGFSGTWKTKKLGEIGEIAGAGVDKKIKLDEVPVRLVNYLDVYHRNFIYSRHLNHYVTAPLAQAQRCAVKKGDVFFTPSSEMPFDIGLSAVAMEDIPDAAYSYHVIRLRLHDDWDMAFRSYAFKTTHFYSQAQTLCEGSGIRYVISQGKFRQMTVIVPPTKPEQIAIAQILGDMDAEIEQLERKLSKYRMIKQGMMQKLLTGKTRLI